MVRNSRNRLLSMKKIIANIQAYNLLFQFHHVTSCSIIYGAFENRSFQSIASMPFMNLLVSMVVRFRFIHLNSYGNLLVHVCIWWFAAEPLQIVKYYLFYLDTKLALHIQDVVSHYFPTFVWKYLLIIPSIWLVSLFHQNVQDGRMVY